MLLLIYRHYLVQFHDKEVHWAEVGRLVGTTSLASRPLPAVQQYVSAYVQPFELTLVTYQARQRFYVTALRYI